MTTNDSTLAATKHTDGWTVHDSDGGVWWPDEDASREIEAAGDPAAKAVEICETEPMRGQWRT